MKALRFILGLVVLCVAIEIVAAGGAFGVILCLPFAFLAGFLFYPFFAAPLERFFCGLFFPTGGKPLRKLFSRIHALIAEREFEQAEAALRQALSDEPDSVAACALLADLLYEHLDRPDEALDLAVATIRSCGNWESDHERLTSLGVDILLDEGRTDAAVDLLRQGARKAGRTPAAARFNERIVHLQGSV